MLKVKNLVKVYKSKGGDEVRALDGVSLDFPERGMVFLLGKSGCGKSTLLNILGGLDRADEGEITVGDRSASAFSESDFDSYRNTFVGFIFQEYNLLDEFTVCENVALALEMQGEKADPDKISDILSRVEMSSFSHRKPNTLSGGQKQRAAIARALVKNPKIIMADEPTGALDSETGKQVLETLKKLSEEKLVLVVSHDREFAEAYGDRIIELKDGKVISDTVKAQAENSLPEDKTVKFISAKLPLKRAVKIGAHSIKGKPFRLAFSVLLSIVAFTIFGLMANFAMFNKYDAGKKAFDASCETYLSVEKKCEYVSNKYEDGVLVSQSRGENGSATFSREEVKELEKKYDAQAILLKNCELSVLNSNNSSVRSFNSNKIRNYAYAGEGSIIRQNIYGRYPEKNNEVAITSYTFDAIKADYFSFINQDGRGLRDYDDVLGKYISLRHSGVPDFVVTGVIDTPVPEKYKEILKTKDYYSDLYDHWVTVRDSGIYPCVFVNEEYFTGLEDNISVYFEKSSVYTGINNKNYSFDYIGTENRKGKRKLELYSFDGEKYSGLIEGNVAAITVNQYAKIVYDYLFEGENASADEDLKQKVSRLRDGKYKVYPDGFGAPDYYFLTDEEKLSYLTAIYDRLGAETLEDLFTIRISKAAVWDEVKVAAVCLVKSDDGGMYLGGELFEKFYADKYGRYEYEYDYLAPEDAFIDGLLLYGGNSVKGAMKDGVMNAQNYRIAINNQSITEVEDIASVLDAVLEIFIYGGIVTALFSCLLLFNFISSSISAKKREIGILRAVGAKKSDVFKIFIAEALIVGGVCFVLSLVATAGVCLGISAYLKKITTVQILSFHFLTLPVLLVLDALVCFISTFIPVMLHSRKPPVDSIRSL